MTPCGAIVEAYEPPVLEMLGTLEELTLGTGQGLPDQGKSSDPGEFVLCSTFPAC